jgi:hypothetical protein
MKICRPFVAVLFVLGSVAGAQNETRIHREFVKEGDALGACFKNLMDCGQTLVLGQPMHITVGSLAPDNGVAVGLAFVEHKNFADEWRMSWDVDGQATSNSSWRAGAYMKAYRLPSGLQYRVAPLFNFYSQSISLNRVDYFGLGPYTLPAGHSTFGFSENITGADAAIPFRIGRSGKFAIVAEINGRFPSVRGGTDASLPSITQLYDESTAPGVTRQPGYFEPGVGFRMYPALFKDHIRLDYLFEMQDFFAPGDSAYSFRRWTGNFQHEIPLYSWLPGALGKRYLSTRAVDFVHNGPDDCTGSNADGNVSLKHAGAKINDAVPCPVVSTTEKLEGSIHLRAFLTASYAGAGSQVPFYFSPTLGGSDVDGTAMLASYPDYRFRGPDLMLFRGDFEHSLGKLPIGAYFSTDQAKIGLRRDDISLDHLRHSFSAGLTIHAGGLPVIEFLYSWGGNEGTHTSAIISPSLLGGSARPTLF